MGTAGITDLSRFLRIVKTTRKFFGFYISNSQVPIDKGRSGSSQEMRPSAAWFGVLLSLPTTTTGLKQVYIYRHTVSLLATQIPNISCMCP